MKELEIAKRAALEAGRLLLSYMGELINIQYKGVRDPVSEADKASEALIASIIREELPDHGFLAEEKTQWEGRGRWIVDPLDGTVNFAHGYPSFAVSIGYELDGQITVGVVYDPCRDEMFSATEGMGAKLNEKPIKVSETSELIRSLLVTGFPYDIDQRPEQVLPLFNRFVLAAQGVRRDGSAALDLCYLAAGRYDGYWERGLKPWDTAAGMLILKEAGGTVTNFEGEPYNPFMDEILASNGKIHGEMQGIIKS
jgi:myo-inositol-1(or 4)-monophosphatase